MDSGVDCFFFEPEQELNPDHDSDEKLDELIINEIHSLQKKTKQLHLASKAAQKTDRLVIFIHGYNNDELAMNKRASDIDHRLGTTQVITTAFNWSSYAKLFKYKGDQQRAEKLAKHFIFYLHHLRKGAHHKFEQIDIVCHSMGNHLLAQAIIHSEKTKQLSLFKNCTVICVAADVPFDLYQRAIVAVQHEISQWIHYYNQLDIALKTSNVVNWDKKRAGQTACTVELKDPNKILSSAWKKSWFRHVGQHGYIDEVFGADDELTNDVLRRLKLLQVQVSGNDPDSDANTVDAKQEELRQHSDLYNTLYQGDKASHGDTWWRDLNVKSVPKYGTFKLQEHTKKNSGLFGVIRAVAPWSNHSAKYRIIHTFTDCNSEKEEKNAKWKDVDHSDNRQKIKQKFDSYLKMVEWKTSIEPK